MDFTGLNNDVLHSFRFPLPLIPPVMGELSSTITSWDTITTPLNFQGWYVAVSFINNINPLNPVKTVSVYISIYMVARDSTNMSPSNCWLFSKSSNSECIWLRDVLEFLVIILKFMECLHLYNQCNIFPNFSLQSLFLFLFFFNFYCIQRTRYPVDFLELREPL